jgi:outer membrane protein assembly factor BamE (lipoprotein component of BamABCDE complex)
MKSKITVKLMFLCFLSLLSGCASVGTNFPSKNIHEIRIGVSKSSVIELLGQPHEKSVVLREGVELEAFEYLYATASSVAFTRPKVRSFSVEFLNESVNGYSFISSFSEDNTDFDIEGRKKLQIGESTKEDVRNALGEPSGMALLPTRIASECGIDKAPDTAREMWKYAYVLSKKTKGNRAVESHTKIVAVYFDEKGHIVDMCHSEEVK